MRAKSLVMVCYLILLSSAEGRQPARSTPPFLPTKGSELAGAVNLPEKNQKLAGSLFLPVSATRIRAVLIVMKHGPTEELLLTGENPYSVWHSMAESLSCALLHLRITPIRAPESGPTPPEVEPMRNATAGGADGLLALMRQFARESARPELADAPFLFWGWSSAAGFGPSFARVHPERTVAFIRYHSHLRGLSLDMQTAREIPALLFVGGQDDAAGIEDATAMFNQGRAVDAPWAIAIRVSVPHQIRAVDIDAVSRLTMPWVAAVVNRRLGAGNRLQALKIADGWLGDDTTGHIVRVHDAEPSPRHRSWLPDEKTAVAWQSLVAPAK